MIPDIYDDAVIDMVRKERQYQYDKWGDQKHSDAEWKAIFEEEFAEFWCKKVCGHPAKDCLQELIETIAVLHAWAKDRIPKEPTHA